MKRKERSRRESIGVDSWVDMLRRREEFSVDFSPRRIRSKRDGVLDDQVYID